MMTGDPVHGEVVSADASAGVAVKFYPSGSATERTLATNEYFEMTDIAFVSTAGGVYSLAMGVAAAGKYMVKGNADALGGLAMSFDTPIVCLKGVTPLLTAAAGQVDLVISGYIKKG